MADRLISKRLGADIDALYRQKELISGISATLKEAKEAFQRIEQGIIDSMTTDEMTVAAGKVAKISLTTEVSPVVEDKEAFYRWGVESGRFEFFQARVNGAPFREMLTNENKLPDGLGSFNKLKTSLTKR